MWGHNLRQTFAANKVTPILLSAADLFRVYHLSAQFCRGVYRRQPSAPIQLLGLARKRPSCTGPSFFAEVAGVPVTGAKCWFAVGEPCLSMR
jgi:hypothetical protein